MNAARLKCVLLDYPILRSLIFNPFIVLLFITQIAGNSNDLAAGPGQDVKVGKLKTATSKRTGSLNGESSAKILMPF